MKHDPFKNPINLGHPPPHGWKYTERGMKRPLQNYNFWATAKTLLAYRKANGISRADFEECQMDILKAERSRRGLTSEESDIVPTTINRSIAVMLEQPTMTRDQKIAAFKKRYAGGGCRSCGKKRSLSR